MNIGTGADEFVIFILLILSRIRTTCYFVLVRICSNIVLMF